MTLVNDVIYFKRYDFLFFTA